MRRMELRELNNRYSISHLLGGGGTSEVFLARDEVLARDVALKVLRHSYARESEFVERFKREARSAAALTHPNIAAVHDLGQTAEGLHYIAMEYVPGVSLSRLLHGAEPLSPRSAAEVALQVAGALGAAHRQGMVHRDIKPGNILLTDSSTDSGGRPWAKPWAKVTDFGLARAASTTTLAGSGEIAGTPHYLAPEQAMGETAGPRSDLYSLGVVLYEMLTGRRPFDYEGSESPLALASKHITEAAPPPRELSPSVPEEMSSLTMRLLGKDPEERPASAAELEEQLELTLEGTRRQRLSQPAHREPRGVETSPRGVDEERGVQVPRRRYRRWRFSGRTYPMLAITASLLVLVFAGLVYAAGSGALQSQLDEMFSRDHAQQEVPDLRGMTLAEARRAVGDRFRISVDGRYRSGDVQGGTIIAATPGPDTVAGDGSVISVVLTGGPNGSTEAKDSSTKSREPQGRPAKEEPTLKGGSGDRGHTSRDASRPEATQPQSPAPGAEKTPLPRGPQAGGKESEIRKPAPASDGPGSASGRAAPEPARERTPESSAPRGLPSGDSRAAPEPAVEPNPAQSGSEEAAPEAQKPKAQGSETQSSSAPEQAAPEPAAQEQQPSAPAEGEGSAARDDSLGAASPEPSTPEQSVQGSPARGTTSVSEKSTGEATEQDGAPPETTAAPEKTRPEANAGSGETSTEPEKAGSETDAGPVGTTQETTSGPGTTVAPEAAPQKAATSPETSSEEPEVSSPQTSPEPETHPENTAPEKSGEPEATVQETAPAPEATAPETNPPGTKEATQEPTASPEQSLPEEATTIQELQPPSPAQEQYRAP